MMVNDRRGLDDDGKLKIAPRSLQRAPMGRWQHRKAEVRAGEGGGWEQAKISDEALDPFRSAPISAGDGLDQLRRGRTPEIRRPQSSDEALFSPPTGVVVD